MLDGMMIAIPALIDHIDRLDKMLSCIKRTDSKRRPVRSDEVHRDSLK